MTGSDGTRADAGADTNLDADADSGASSNAAETATGESESSTSPESTAAVPGGDWRLIREERRPGPLQMALDEVAAETAAAGGPSTIRVYGWGPSCLSMGYGQDPDTVDWGFCADAGIDVTRRQTGGGGIYHDGYGDIAYSIAVPASEVPGELLACYHLLCTPVLDAFDQLGLAVDFVDDAVPELYRPACYLRALHPAHDMVAGDGRKIAGNAQYRKRDAVIQHGSITYAVDVEQHLGVFADPPVSAETFTDRVVGIDELAPIDRAAAVTALEESLASWVSTAPRATLDWNGAWTDAELDRAHALVDTKYRADEWVRRQRGGNDR